GSCTTSADCASAFCTGAGVCDAELLASGQITGQWVTQSIVVDAVNLYWLKIGVNGALNKMPIAGGPVVKFATPTGASRSLSQSGITLVWNNTGAAATIERTYTNGGGNVTTIASAQ